MHEYKPEQAEEQQQKQIYNDLSILMAYYRKIFQYAEKIILELDRDLNCSNVIESVRNQIKQNSALISKYDYVIKQNYVHRNIFYRFVCRLKQFIDAYRIKVNQKNQSYQNFLQLITKTDNAVRKYQLDKNIGLIFKSINQLLAKFTYRCQNLIKKSTQEEFEDQQKQQEKIEKIKPNLKLKQTSPINTQTTTNFNKVLKGINQRFLIFTHLDLDYNEFKSTFFLSKSSQQELFAQSISRNQYILEAINSYSKRFQEYLKKKQKYIFYRKNKFQQQLQQKQREGRYKTQKSTNSQSPNKKVMHPLLVPIWQNKNSERSINNQNSKVAEVEKLMEIESRRTSYQMKNVYLTLNSTIKNISKPGNNHRQIKKQKQFLHNIRNNITNMKTAKIISTTVNNYSNNANELTPVKNNFKIEQNKLRIYNSEIVQIGQNSVNHGYEKLNRRKRQNTERKNIRITSINNNSINLSKMISIIQKQTNTSNNHCHTQESCLNSDF